jgi:hypothetical protein
LLAVAVCARETAEVSPLAEANTGHEKRHTRLLRQRWRKN